MTTDRKLNVTMSDFFQTGAIATLHRLGQPNVPRIEQELRSFAEETPIALVLPCHVRELDTRALRHIVRELKNVDYIKQIVVGIDGANLRGWKKAKRFSPNSRKNPSSCGTRGPGSRLFLKSWTRRSWMPGRPARGATFGFALAMCWPASRRAWWQCTIATS